MIIQGIKRGLTLDEINSKFGFIDPTPKYEKYIFLEEILNVVQLLLLIVILLLFTTMLYQFTKMEINI